MTIQLAIRVDDQIAAEIDLLVPGRYANRTEVVRAALNGLLDREHRAEIGRRIVAGYQNTPPGELSEAVAVAARHQNENLEPWDWAEA